MSLLASHPPTTFHSLKPLCCPVPAVFAAARTPCFASNGRHPATAWPLLTPANLPAAGVFTLLEDLWLDLRTGSIANVTAPVNASFSNATAVANSGSVVYISQAALYTSAAGLNFTTFPAPNTPLNFTDGQSLNT